MATRRGFIQQGLMAGGALGLAGVGVTPAAEAQNPAPHTQDGEPSMNIGIIIFPRMDQIDFTGPFEVLSRVPGAAVQVLWKEETPVRDIKGLLLTPERTLAEAPPLDVLFCRAAPGRRR